MIDFPQMVSVSHRNAQMYVIPHLCTTPQYSLPIFHTVFLVCYEFCLSGTLTVISNASSSFSEKGRLPI